MDVDEARRILVADSRRWLIGTELIGASRKKRRLHEEREQELERLHIIDCQKKKELSELPDEDLQWLLDNGWSPLDN